MARLYSLKDPLVEEAHILPCENSDKAFRAHVATDDSRIFSYLNSYNRHQIAEHLCAMDMDILAAKFVHYHVVLPPKLPQGDDTNPEHELALLRFVLSSLDLFQAVLGQEVVHAISNMFRNGIAVRDDAGTINENQLVAALQALATEGLSSSRPVERLQLTIGTGGALPLLVKA